MVVRLIDTYSFILPPLIFSFPHSQPEPQLLEVFDLVVVTRTFISEVCESSTPLTLLAAVFLHPPSLSGMEMMGSTVPGGASFPSSVQPLPHWRVQQTRDPGCQQLVL